MRRVQLRRAHDAANLAPRRRSGGELKRQPIRKLLFQGTTQYIHGAPAVHRAGWHHQRILHYLDIGERHGLPALLRLVAMPE